MTTEAGAESAHPPKTIGHGVTERAFENEIDRWAADVSELAQHGRTVANGGFAQAELFTQGENYSLSARMKNPTGDLFALHPGRSEAI